MYTKKRFGFFEALGWTALVFPPLILWPTSAVVLHSVVGWESLQLPGMPIGILGTAVAFYTLGQAR
ncbi:MAG: hypothetical protein ACI9VR_001068 [Cognaticolwellia sp.]|jgi:hypothetical protein